MGGAPRPGGGPARRRSARRRGARARPDRDGTRDHGGRVGGAPGGEADGRRTDRRGRDDGSAHHPDAPRARRSLAPAGRNRGRRTSPRGTEGARTETPDRSPQSIPGKEAGAHGSVQGLRPRSDRDERAAPRTAPELTRHLGGGGRTGADSQE